MQSWRAKITMCLARVNRLRGASTGLLLDVGCGKGWFLETARERGWRVEGVELCREVARNHGEVSTQVHVGSIFDVELPSETFDLVTMYDVISTLKRLSKRSELLSNSKTRRSIGNQHAEPSWPSVPSVGARAFAVWPDEHIFYFGPASMSRALRMAHFTNVEIATREYIPRMRQL